LVSIDYEHYKVYLNSKFNHQYAKLIYTYSIKYQALLDNPAEIQNIAVSIRSNVLRALVNLAKYLGHYEEFKTSLKQYGIKWAVTDNSFTSFLAIVNNNHSTLGKWYNDALAVLDDNEKLYLRYMVLSGLRKAEGIESFNLIIELAGKGKLSEYWNSNLGILEHFKMLDTNGKHIFLRRTKNCYLSAITEDLVKDIATSKYVYYTTIRKHLEKHKLTLRIKELRSYYATYLRNNGIISELVDLLQGRIPKDVFCRHYLKIEDMQTLTSQVIGITSKMESSLLNPIVELPITAT